MYIKKQYIDKLSDQDIERLQNLYSEDMNQLDISFHGRSPCKRLSISSLNSENLVVKDYWHGGFFGKMLRDIFWQEQRPLNELSIYETARERGINTIETMAIVKNRMMGPFFKCKLISREIVDSVDLMELLLDFDGKYTLVQKRQIINEVARAVRKMHDAGIYHGDLHLKNILLQCKDNNEFNVFIIDLDKSEQFKEIDFHRRISNIKRLDRSLEKYIRNNREMYHGGNSITKRDRIRFLKEYIRSGTKPVRQDSDMYDKTLKSYLQSSSTTHKLHRLWWFVRGANS